MKKTADKTYEKARSMIYAYYCGLLVLAVAFILMPFTNKNVDLNRTPIVINGILFWVSLIFSIVMLIVSLRTVNTKTKHYKYEDFVTFLRFPGFIGKSGVLTTDVLLIIAAITFIITLLINKTLFAFISLAIIVVGLGMRLLFGLLKIVNTKKRRV